MHFEQWWCCWMNTFCDFVYQSLMRLFPEIQSMFERYFRRNWRQTDQQQEDTQRYRSVCQNRPALCLSLLLEKKEHFEVFSVEQVKDEGEAALPDSCVLRQSAVIAVLGTVCGRRTGFFPSHSLFPHLCSHFVHLASCTPSSLHLTPTRYLCSTTKNRTDLCMKFEGKRRSAKTNKQHETSCWYLILTSISFSKLNPTTNTRGHDCSVIRSSL